MAIKMRVNKDPNAICCECGETKSQALEMFDLCVGGKILTLCDVCNEKIFYKTVKADVMVQGKVMSSRDMKIIRTRNADKSGRYGPRYG